MYIIHVHFEDLKRVIVIMTFLGGNFAKSLHVFGSLGKKYN